jgi:hypothetical protein
MPQLPHGHCEPAIISRPDSYRNGIDITILLASRDHGAQPYANAEFHLHVCHDNATDARQCDSAGAAADERHEGAQFGEEEV